MLIGAHVSVAGGLLNAIKNGEALGCGAIQIFGASPRQWSAVLPSPAVASEFKAARAKSQIKEVYLHAPYLINLASEDEMMLKKSIACLASHLKISEAIGADGVIFHVGSEGGADKATGLKQSAEAMKKILKLVPGKSLLIMENSASLKKVGADFKELSQMLKLAKSSRVKVCLDTAHSFESGLIKAYTPENIKKFAADFKKIIGEKYLAAVHANDSKTVAGSNFDRHENIGEGYIGLEGFRNLAQNELFNKVAWLLEVPGFDDQGPDKRNVEILKGCVK